MRRRRRRQGLWLAELERPEGQAAQEAEEAEGARDRVRAGEDRGEGPQGAEGEGDHEVRLRGRADPAPPPRAEAGFQEPLQPHFPGACFMGRFHCLLLCSRGAIGDVVITVSWV